MQGDIEMRCRRKSDGLEVEMQPISYFGFKYVIVRDGAYITNYVDKNKLDSEWEKIEGDNVVRRE